MAIVGYWRLNGNSNDASGNGNNGTDTGIDYKPGISNSSALFNASSDKIVIANKSNFDYDRNVPFSVLCWIKFTSVSSFQLIIGKQLSSGNYTGWLFWKKADNKFTVDMYYSVSPLNVVSAHTYAYTTTNKWLQIGFTYSGNNHPTGIKFYKDGILYPQEVDANTYDLLANSILNDVSVEIGNRGGAYNFAGNIDNIFFDNTELSAVRVKNEYALMKGFF